jgi:S1-C subfamily serine protease
MEVSPTWLLDAEWRARTTAKPEEVVVSHLVRDGPAHLAGARFGDVLVRYAGKDVPAVPVADHEPETDPLWWLEHRLRANDAFLALAAAVKPGADVEMVLRRDDQTLTLTAKAIDAASIGKLAVAVAEAMVASAPAVQADARGFVGIVLRAVPLLTEGWRRYLGTSATQGVVVLYVSEGLPAQAAGVRAGAIVESYAGNPAPDTKGLDPVDTASGRKAEDAIAKMIAGVKPGDVVEVRLVQDGKPLVLRLTAVSRLERERAQAAAIAQVSF